MIRNFKTPLLRCAVQAPESMDEVSDELFPLFLSFSRFLVMLDSTFAVDSRFFKSRSDITDFVGKEDEEDHLAAAGGRMRSGHKAKQLRYVAYEDFRDWWGRYFAALLPTRWGDKCEPVYTEIMTCIKGGAQGSLRVVA